MNSSDKKYIRRWYWSGAIIVLLMVIIGGITRLTGSGLSMSDWRPIMGIIPPISETAWQDAFDYYKQFPEYQQVNRGMNLSEFKTIFFWEYLHRMAGRMLGLVFLIPFGYFLIRKKMDSTQIRRALILLFLGISQGLMGWYMVKSGLVDIPAVSHYRLAAHLMLAFIIFGCCVWFALDLYKKSINSKLITAEHKLWLYAILLFLVVQIIWGAFTAGLHAGHIYNTFPKMFSYWFPPELWLSEPLYINFIENIVTVQWFHRVMGTLLGLFAIIYWIRTLTSSVDKTTKMWAFALFTTVLVQYAIGVFTLIYHVPVWLGVIHQAFAMVLFGVVIGAIHNITKPKRKKKLT